LRDVDPKKWRVPICPSENNPDKLKTMQDEVCKDLTKALSLLTDGKHTKRSLAQLFEEHLQGEVVTEEYFRELEEVSGCWFTVQQIKNLDLAAKVASTFDSLYSGGEFAMDRVRLRLRLAVMTCDVTYLLQAIDMLLNAHRD
jgi:hypothetical protein